MSEVRKLWEQLQREEKRGDLLAQKNILLSLCQTYSLTPTPIIEETFQILLESAQQYLKKNPDPLYALNTDNLHLHLCNSGTLEIQKQLKLPIESNISPEIIAWSSIGQVELLNLQTESGKIEILSEYRQLTPEQKGFIFHRFYPYLNIDFQPQNKISIRSLIHPAIPIDNIRSLPFDFFVSHRHEHLAIIDRSAQKIHLIHRENFRIIKTWHIPKTQAKKCINLTFHPDGKRIFYTFHQNKGLGVIDRAIAMKSLPVGKDGILGALNCSPKGDLLYILKIDPNTRRPDILILDTEKYQIQGLIPLEGEAFSMTSDPRDVFEISPRGDWGIVLVAKNQPKLFTPTLLLVNLKTGKMTDQVALDSEKKPVNIGFPVQSFYPPQFQLRKNLVRLNQFDQENFEKILEADVTN